MNGQAIRTVPPAVLPVTLAEFKSHVRYFEPDEDAIMVAYIRAAVEEVENYTGLALINQTWTETFSAWPTTQRPDMILHRRPVQSVTQVDFSFTGGSPEGEMALLDPGVYRVLGLGGDRVSARLQLASGQVWPSLYSGGEPIRVTYVAGFGPDHNSVPELIRHAILMMAGTWFEHRSDLIVGTIVEEIPTSSKALLRYWRHPVVA
jgi:uncharacterized phiE125 gp8 family phage protein